MPSKDHEFPLELFRERPRLVIELLRTFFGIAIPEDAQVSLGSEAYPDIKPAEYICDLTVMVDDPEKPSMGVVVEWQTRPDRRKAFTWPVYLAGLRARRECSVILLVLCPDEATARACATPIDFGHPGWVLRPLTFSPERLPPVTDPDKARRHPEITVLSAPVHADGPDAEAVLRCLSAAIEVIDDDVGRLYIDYAESHLSVAARKLLEEIVKLENPKWRSEFALRHIAEGEARGEARGEAKMLLVVLAGRGIEVTDEMREHIVSCTDTARLELWAQRALTAETIEQVID